MTHKATRPLAEPGTAWLYLRVSTSRQASKGGEPEGLSIPAQRQANTRKAEALGAVVTEEFVEAGESARSANRPALQEMLSRLEIDPPEYLIVHKIDRLARNRADDVEINLAIRRAGTTLVSVSENIDETPSGRLLHGIMSDIAEFYSANLASEVTKGLRQKAQNGDTIGRAPVGYRNVRRTVNGVERRTVELDPERTPLMAWAFQQYATGEWTLISMTKGLERRGLTHLPSAKWAEKAITENHLWRCLTNRYYVGKIVYSGIEYEGQHDALVDEATFQKVQQVLNSRARDGEKQRTHPHYLKSSLFCLQCGSRLIVSVNTNRHGTSYPYFICLGRHQKRTTCRQKAQRIEKIEARVEELYDLPDNYLTANETEDLQAYLSDEIERLVATSTDDQIRIANRKRQLEDERLKLLQAHYAGAVPLDLLRSEQDRIALELDHLDSKLASGAASTEQLTTRLQTALDYLTHVRDAYLSAGPRDRRRINQAFFERILVGEDDQIEGHKTDVYAILTDSHVRNAAVAYRMLRETFQDEPMPKTGAEGLSGTPHGARTLPDRSRRHGHTEAPEPPPRTVDAPGARSRSNKNSPSSPGCVMARV